MGASPSTSPVDMLSLDAAQLGTILAALRFYQSKGLGDPDSRPADIHQIATNAGEVMAGLDDAGIDALCERLGQGEAMDQAGLTHEILKVLDREIEARGEEEYAQEMRGVREEVVRLLVQRQALANAMVAAHAWMTDYVDPDTAGYSAEMRAAAEIIRDVGVPEGEAVDVVGRDVEPPAVMLRGNPREGFSVHGPYLSRYAAVEAGDAVDSEWWVFDLDPPA